MKMDYESIAKVAGALRELAFESPSYNMARTLGGLADEIESLESKSKDLPVWARDALDLLREVSDGLGWTPDRRRTADAILRSAAMAKECQSKGRIPTRDGAYSVRIGTKWVEAEWDGDYLHVPGGGPHECDVVDEWGPWLRPLRPEKTEQQSATIHPPVVRPTPPIDDEYHLTTEQGRAVNRALARSVEVAPDLTTTECKSIAPGHVSVEALRELAASIDAEADEVARKALLTYDDYGPGEADGLRRAASMIEDLAKSAQHGEVGAA
jgi:hypothetical protein